LEAVRRARPFVSSGLRWQNFRFGGFCSNKVVRKSWRRSPSKLRKYAFELVVKIAIAESARRYRRQ
jgi:hypothetical protein